MIKIIMNQIIEENELLICSILNYMKNDIRCILYFLYWLFLNFPSFFFQLSPFCFLFSHLKYTFISDSLYLYQSTFCDENYLITYCYSYYSIIQLFIYSFIHSFIYFFILKLKLFVYMLMWFNNSFPSSISLSLLLLNYFFFYFMNCFFLLILSHFLH